MKAESGERRAESQTQPWGGARSWGLVQFSANSVLEPFDVQAENLDLTPSEESRESRVQSPESGERRAESREQKFRIPHSAIRIRTAITLVELLVTIVILAIIGTTIVGASRVAMEGAREAKTKMMITKLHTLVLERVESYQTCRVEFNRLVQQELNALSTGTSLRGMVLADARLLAVRDLMRLEMPEKWSDIIGDNVGKSYPDQEDYPNQYPTILKSLPSLTRAYRRRYEDVKMVMAERAKPQNDDLKPEEVKEIIEQYQGAESLYMIIMMSTADGEARTLFSQQDIGDVDRDGAKEFLDGWGNPIQFLRWPAGFVDQSDLMSGNPFVDHDPFDYFRRDMVGVILPEIDDYPVVHDTIVGDHAILKQQVSIIRARQQSSNPITSAFRLVPLIYSAGSDGAAGIITADDFTVVVGTTIEPYIYYGRYIGSLEDENKADHIDNIHNHLLD